MKYKQETNNSSVLNISLQFYSQTQLTVNIIIFILYVNKQLTLSGCSNEERKYLWWDVFQKLKNPLKPARSMR
jgi:hypothetical protein